MRCGVGSSLGQPRPHAAGFRVGVLRQAHRGRLRSETSLYADYAHEEAEALIALATEQGFALFLAIGGILRGGTRTALGQRGEQIGQIRQDLAAVRETGSALWEPYLLALLADV